MPKVHRRKKIISEWKLLNEIETKTKLTNLYIDSPRKKRGASAKSEIKEEKQQQIPQKYKGL